jgi:hypothetical protein
MAKYFLICSWCGEKAEAQAVGKTYCELCGHRADVPQSNCDCRKCRRRAASPPAPQKRWAAA